MYLFTILVELIHIIPNYIEKGKYIVADENEFIKLTWQNVMVF